MYTVEDLAKLGGHEFAELLQPMSWRDLKDLLVYMVGYSPEGMARALNLSELEHIGFTEEMERAGRTAKDEPVITDSARTCQAKHPETGDWCVIEGAPHMLHRDCYGQKFGSVAEVAASR